MQFVFGNVSKLKSMPLPTADLFTVTAWIWNVAIHTADIK
jgi:hypothetical protein